MRVDYVREMNVKKSCKYSKYESLEHLLLLFLLLSNPFMPVLPIAYYCSTAYVCLCLFACMFSFVYLLVCLLLLSHRALHLPFVDIVGRFYIYQSTLTLNFLVALVNTLNTKTHSSKERAKFSFENADAKSICYYKERMKSKLSLFLKMCRNEAL